MPRESPRLDIKKEKTIDEIESELDSLQKKVDYQTNQLKSILKERGVSEEPLSSEHKNYTLSEAKAELYASIATLNHIISTFHAGALDPSTYNHQLVIQIEDIQKFKLILLKMQTDLPQFIQRENIIEKFSGAYQKLKEMEIF